MPDSPERHYDVFLRVAARLQVLDDLQAQLDEIASGVVEAQTYRRALISLLDDDWNVIKIGSAGVDEAEVDIIRKKPPLAPAERRRLLDERYRVGDSYFIPHDSAEVQEMLKGALRSHYQAADFVDWHPDDVLFVPLTGRRGQMLGTLSVDDPFDGLRPTAKSLRVLELFAREAAVTIETSILGAELLRVRTYLETLIESIPDAIIACDRNGDVVLFNSGAAEMTGYTKDEIIGNSVLNLYASEEIAKRVMFGLRAKGERGESGKVYAQEVEFKTKEGGTIPGFLSASILRDPSGREIGSAGVCKDLRPIRKLEERLIKAEKIATVGEVATMLSHEVNNFLSSILSAVALSDEFLESENAKKVFTAGGLGDEVAKEKYRLEVIRGEALRIGEITENLHKMARGSEYETVPYVEGVSMLDVGQTLEKMTAAREIRVLVADDKLYIRKFLREILEHEGMIVEDVENGDEVVKRLAEPEYACDLVISDIKMPGRNGYEVSKEVAEMRPGVPVILITAFGYDPSHSAVRGNKERNVAAVLYKPFDINKLKEAVAATLAKR